MIGALPASRVIGTSAKGSVLTTRGGPRGLRSTVTRRLAMLLRSLRNSPAARAAFSTMADSKIALSPAEFRAFRVTSVESVSPNTKKVVFALPSADHEMGLTVASCLVAKAIIDGEPVIRPYTPTNLNSDKGFLELVVKGYPNGKLSKHIVELQVGDELEMKGPFVKFEYKPNHFSRVGLIAGGSGITPAYQVIKQVVSDASDATQVDLIFANNTEEDILLRKELDAIVAQHSNVRVHYVLTHPSEGWTGHVGFVTPELVKKVLPAPDTEGRILIGVCGPPPMMEAISGDKNPDKTQGELRGFLKELQYTSEQVFKF